VALFAAPPCYTVFVAVSTEVLTSALALDILAKVAPYKTYHDLEVATRGMFRAHCLSVPRDYTYRDFLTWAFSNHKIVQTRLGFAVT
jgi:hypothetical protein